MIRITIRLDSADEQWLRRAARREGVSAAALIRRAVRRLRGKDAGELVTFEALLVATAGIWNGEDGLVYQNRLRREWSADEGDTTHLG